MQRRLAPVLSAQQFRASYLIFPPFVSSPFVDQLIDF
jgi:hypothetical protein